MNTRKISFWVLGVLVIVGFLAVAGLKSGGKAEAVPPTAPVIVTGLKDIIDADISGNVFHQIKIIIEQGLWSDEDALVGLGINPVSPGVWTTGQILYVHTLLTAAAVIGSNSLIHPDSNFVGQTLRQTGINDCSCGAICCSCGPGDMPGNGGDGKGEMDCAT